MDVFVSAFSVLNFPPGSHIGYMAKRSDAQYSRVERGGKNFHKIFKERITWDPFNMTSQHYSQYIAKEHPKTKCS